MNSYYREVYHSHREEHRVKEKQKRWERSHSRDDYRHHAHNRQSSYNPPIHRYSPSNANSLIEAAYPKLLQTLQHHQASLNRHPFISGLLQSPCPDLLEATLRLKTFILKLAVDIDSYFLDHHNQLKKDSELKMCKSQETDGGRRVRLYHFRLHVEERTGDVHALDVLEYETLEAPYALRLCPLKSH